MQVKSIGENLIGYHDSTVQIGDFLGEILVSILQYLVLIHKCAAESLD